MDKLRAAIKAVQCLRLSADDSAGVVVVVVLIAVVGIVVVGVDVFVAGVVADIVVVLGSTLTSKLALTIVLPWRIFNSHKPLTKISR